ncbi:hypothetical protein [Seonamhaeicola sp. ML3]|uniref:hypothetical protein n=1 Tax=Seonamhaeicola sp. ML3 TaxID=2937786 RepID=UPI00200BC380|nr:hypothetical protein [Seonamhaeicola sp. ML3]
MKVFFRLGFISLFSGLLISCSSEPSNPMAIIIGASLEASISNNTSCSTNINFEDLDNNVYAYRADAGFAKPTVQAGGHSTIDESTDLGFNIFIDLDNLEKENYTIDDASATVGSAYVFYRVGTTEYFSTDNNTGSLVVERLELDSDSGMVLSLRATFNNVEVVNVSNPNDVRCINKFKISY